MKTEKIDKVHPFSGNFVVLRITSAGKWVHSFAENKHDVHSVALAELNNVNGKKKNTLPQRVRLRDFLFLPRLKFTPSENATYQEIC